MLRPLWRDGPQNQEQGNFSTCSLHHHSKGPSHPLHYFGDFPLGSWRKQNKAKLEHSFLRV